MTTPKPSDAERPTPQASPMRDCRDSWPSLCDAVRRRPGRRRTRLFPFLLPGPAVSTARPTGFRQTPRTAATDNSPSCSWPCGARPRHLRQYVRELSFSIEHLHLPDRRNRPPSSVSSGATPRLSQWPAGKRKGARGCPFAGFSRFAKYERIRGIETDLWQQLHASVLPRS